MHFNKYQAKSLLYQRKSSSLFHLIKDWSVDVASLSMACLYLCSIICLISSYNDQGYLKIFYQWSNCNDVRGLSFQFQTCYKLIIVGLKHEIFPSVPPPRPARPHEQQNGLTEDIFDTNTDPFDSVAFSPQGSNNDALAQFIEMKVRLKSL